MSPDEANSLYDFLRKEFTALSLSHEAKWVFEEIKDLDSCSAHDRAEEILLRRKKQEPLAYILGHWDFRKLRLNVGPGVLIPRPETEELVEHALEHIAKHSVKNVADLGSGSGAIALSLAEEALGLEHVYAVEKSPEAFEYLKKNASLLSQEKQRKLKLLHSDWQKVELPELDMIVSNPPYVSLEEFQDLDIDVRSFEPKAALVPLNEGDPMSAYRDILDLARKKLRIGGAIFFEFGPAQEGKWEPLLNDFSYRIYKDLSGKPRVLYAFDFSPKTR